MSQKNLNATSKTHKNLFNYLKDKRIFQIYKKFEKKFSLKEDFIVAVSGGPDSLALSFLTKIYSVKKSLSVKYYIVDHRLRKNSSFESISVKNHLKKFHISADILKWTGIKPTSNIQSLAREKRYSLLISQAKKLNIRYILTGHHLNDLYENFFIRILRGSGLNGLISLDEKAINQEINIFRPLINFEKNDLIYLSKKIFNFYINDPSNFNDKFKRVRIRNLINNFNNEGLDKHKLLLTIKNLKDSNETIKFYTEKNLKDNCHFYKNKVILNSKFFNQPHEITFRSVMEIIKYVGNKHYPVRGKKVDKIINLIKHDNRSNLKATLGNCVFIRVNHSIIVIKEQ